MKFLRMQVMLGCVVAVCVGWFLCPATTLAFDIQIDVAPNVLNLQSQGVVVTVHTDIAYHVVVAATVFLNGIPIDHWKSDARGNFVAKFVSDEIKTLDGLILDDYNSLVLTGYDTSGEAFIGTQDIKVIDVIPQGQN